MIDEILKSRRILISCGTGGVGKTTLSAALAIRAAQLGKNAVVITIDPAKRLATSLGVEKLSDQPTDLTERLRAACGEPIPGTLAAIVPDTRHTFENFVRGLATRPSVAERVMANPIFQIFAKEFSGTNEYMALERLYALAQDPSYDCIILDTPPSQNTLAFLEAPGLLARLFEEKFIRWLAIPTNKIMAAGMKKALGLLERLTGQGFMTHLLEFSTALLDVQTRFTANLKKVDELLLSPQVGFVAVTALLPGTEADLHRFVDQLDRRDLHFDGILVNRSLAGIPERESGVRETAGMHKTRCRATLGLDLVRKLRERENQVLRKLTTDPRMNIISRVPELARDVHSVEDLVHVANALSASDRSFDPGR